MSQITWIIMGEGDRSGGEGEGGRRTNVIIVS